MLTGIDAIRHGVNYEDPMPSALSTLAEVLKNAGYRTRAVTGGGYLHPRYGFAQGFDAYRYWDTVSNPRDDEFVRGVDRALTFMERNARRPFFLFLHTYALHSPYRDRDPNGGTSVSSSGSRTIALEQLPLTASEGFVPHHRPRWLTADGHPGDLLSAREVGVVHDFYDSGITFADDQLARLFDYLHTSGLERDTIVVLTSDHGEMLGEGGHFDHRYLFDENLLIPLIVSYPASLPRGRRIPDQVRSVDILPTILDLAGLEPVRRIDGRSLTSLIDGHSDTPRDAWSYTPASNAGVALRTASGFKYIFNNTALFPTGFRERVSTWKDDLGPRGEVAGRSEQTRRLRARAQRHLDEVSGLRIQFSNDSSSSFSGVLQSSLIRPTTVKTSGQLCDCMTWEGDGRVSFTVPTADTYTLLLENAGG